VNKIVLIGSDSTELPNVGPYRPSVLLLTYLLWAAYGACCVCHASVWSSSSMTPSISVEDTEVDVCSAQIIAAAVAVTLTSQETGKRRR